MDSRSENNVAVDEVEVEASAIFCSLFLEEKVISDFNYNRDSGTVVIKSCCILFCPIIINFGV